jgi:hypothetical protein
MFMRRTPVSPPDGSIGTLLKTWKVKENRIAEGALNSVMEDGVHVAPISHVSGGARVQFADFTRHGKFPDAKTLTLSPARTSLDQIPIHWLPWKTLKIVSASIPAVPRNLVEADEDENPRFFFTAGINGCSVFVKGPPTKPTLYHAGIDGKLAEDAGAFWREQLETATKGTHMNLEQTLGEVNRNDYMKRDSQAIQDYLKWVQSGSNNPFTVEVINNFGCVFGMRFGHHWSFYLQESALIETAKFLTRKEVRKTDGARVEKSTGFAVTKQTFTSSRRLGPIPLPRKSNSVYASTHQRCVTFRVSEIFPNRHWAGELKDIINAHVM